MIENRSAQNARPTLRIPAPGAETPPEQSGSAEEPKETLKDRVKKAARETALNARTEDGWEGAYAGLTNTVTSFYIEEVNKSINPILEINKDLFGTLENDINAGPPNVVQNCENELGNLLMEAGQAAPKAKEFAQKLSDEKKIYPNLTMAAVKKTKVKSKGDLAIFAGILAVIILVESLANMSLLGSVLSGGLIEAFIVAVMVSVINVAALGAGVGYFCFWLYRVKREALLFLVPLQALGALFLNLVVGRHREAFVIDIAEKEKLLASNGAESAAFNLSAVDVTDVSFNFLQWSFESVIFFLLGIALCMVGFYKGYSFIKPGENIKDVLDEQESLKERIWEGWREQIRRHLQQLEDLRDKVDWRLADLMDAAATGEGKIQMLKLGWDSMLILIDTTFIATFNQVNPNANLTREKLASIQMRQFPETQRTENTIQNAKERVAWYKKQGQRDFHGSIETSKKSIADLKGRYKTSIQDRLSGE